MFSSPSLPPQSSSSSLLLLLILFSLRGCSELERGCVLPLLETPLNHRPARSDALKPAIRQLVSFSPLSARIHWTFQGGGGVAKSSPPQPLWLLIPYYWMLTMNLPCLVCLSVQQSVSYVSVCLLHRLSICTKCHSVITFLQTLHWPPTMTSSLTVFTCTFKFNFLAVELDSTVYTCSTVE